MNVALYMDYECPTSVLDAPLSLIIFEDNGAIEVL